MSDSGPAERQLWDWDIVEEVCGVVCTLVVLWHEGRCFGFIYLLGGKKLAQELNLEGCAWIISAQSTRSISQHSLSCMDCVSSGFAMCPTQSHDGTYAGS